MHEACVGPQRRSLVLRSPVLLHVHGGVVLTRANSCTVLIRCYFPPCLHSSADIGLHPYPADRSKARKEFPSSSEVDLNHSPSSKYIAHFQEVGRLGRGLSSCSPSSGVSRGVNIRIRRRVAVGSSCHLPGGRPCELSCPSQSPADFCKLQWFILFICELDERLLISWLSEVTPSLLTATN